MVCCLMVWWCYKSVLPLPSCYHYQCEHNWVLPLHLHIHPQLHVLQQGGGSGSSRHRIRRYGRHQHHHHTRGQHQKIGATNHVDTAATNDPTAKSEFLPPFASPCRLRSSCRTRSSHCPLGLLSHSPCLPRHRHERNSKDGVRAQHLHGHIATRTHALHSPQRHAHIPPVHSHTPTTHNARKLPPSLFPPLMLENGAGSRRRVGRWQWVPWQWVWSWYHPLASVWYYPLASLVLNS